MLARRLAQTGIVDAADGARLQARLRPGQRLVSTAGDLWRWDGYTAAADAPTAAARRLAQRNRLDELAARHRRRRRAPPVAARGIGGGDRRRGRGGPERQRETREAARRAQRELNAASDRLAAAERKASQDTARLGALAEANAARSEPRRIRGARAREAPRA